MTVLLRILKSGYGASLSKRICTAACLQLRDGQGKLMVCFATNATLIQNGKMSQLDFERGTIYANDTDDFQPLVMSTEKVPPHSIMFSMTTKRGTEVTLSGRVDQVVK